MSDITDERMATALERIADALERAHPAKFNPGGLVQPPWNITATVPNRVELEPVPNQPGVFRRVKHAAWDDCERPADPLDESDHRPRHLAHADGNYLYRHGPKHWHGWDPDGDDQRGRCPGRHGWDSLATWGDGVMGPLTICDCDTIESKNGATD